ncbi:MAG: SLC13 family permease [Bryobacterales bacterium]|nr:SLC13 family permease [Bryobacterales bacterium]
MSLVGLLSIGVVVAVVAALATNRVAVETAMLTGLLAQILIGAVEPEAALAGFSHSAVVAIGALFVVAAGLFETGTATAAANLLLGRPRSVRGAQLRLILPVTLLSAFINNTPVVAMYLPIVRDWAKRIRVSPSKLLMPLSFSSILGGQLTLVGSASNLIVMGLYVKHLAEIGADTPSPLLQFWGPALLGLPLAGVGLAYLVCASPGLLPERRQLADEWESARRYTVQMDVLPNSSVAGATIEAAGLRSLPGLFLFEIERSGLVIPAPGPDTALRAGDRLGFTGALDSVVDLQRIRGLAPTQHQQDDGQDPPADRELVEAVIPASSPLVGQTVRQARIRTVFNAAVIAVHRSGALIRRKVGEIELQHGDTLLLETSAGFTERYRNSGEFCLVSPVPGFAHPRHDRMWRAVAVTGALVAGVAFTAWPPVVVCLCAALLMVFSGCVRIGRALESIPLQVLVAVAAALGIGSALAQSGAAAGVAAALLDLGQSLGLGHRGMLLALVLSASAFAQVISKNGAAALAFPIAMATARELGLHPEPFAFSLIVGCGLSFLSPMSYQTNLMVYGPGGYRFTDFPKVGLPLTILLALLCVLLCPWIFPFRPL